MMEKMKKQFAKVSKHSKDEYMIPDRLWQAYWKETVESMLDELVEGYNEIMKKLERDTTSIETRALYDVVVDIGARVEVLEHKKVEDYEEWKRCKEQDIGLTYDDADK